MKKNNCEKYFKEAQVIIGTRFGIYCSDWDSEIFYKLDSNAIYMWSGQYFASWYIEALIDHCGWDLKKVIKEYWCSKIIHDTILSAADFDIYSNKNITFSSL